MLYSLLSAMDTVKTVLTYVLIIAAFGALVFFLGYLPNKREMARREEEAKKISAIKVGSKIKTIGGIFGVIVEVNDEENSFVIETGSEEHKGYLKIDKRAVYDTDAVVPEETPAEATENTPSEPVEEPFEETATEETPVETEEAPVEETVEETEEVTEEAKETEEE